VEVNQNRATNHNARQHHIVEEKERSKQPCLKHAAGTAAR